MDDKNYNQYKSNLNKIESSGSYVCLYIGFNQTADELGIKDTNLWISPGYDHDKNLNEYKNKYIDFENQNYYFVLNKPKGYVCSKKDEYNRKIIFDLMYVALNWALVELNQWCVKS